MEDSSETDSPAPPTNSVKALFSFYSSFLPYIGNSRRQFSVEDRELLRLLETPPPEKLPSPSFALRCLHYFSRPRFYCCLSCNSLVLVIRLLFVIVNAVPFSTCRVTSEASRIFEVLEDIIDDTLRNLHIIQKNLLFWQSTAEGSNARKAYFMICQRGPGAFIDGTRQIMRDSLADLYCLASSHISERISVLNSLRYFLATFLVKVYVEVDRIGEDLVQDLENSLPSLLVTINDLFLKLEASIGHFHANRQSGSSVEGSYSVPLIFAKLPEVNQEGSQWTQCEIKDAINLIYDNLQRLDSYLSVLVSKHRKPRRVTLYWMRYSCGALGISICSLWLLRHSKLMGSSDIDNWIKEAKDSTVSFWNGHVEQPILAIRDELFETFRERQKGVMEREEVQLTADSLHRYEKELMHPIQGLVGGELARSLLIQVQKLKLDIEEAMLELDQILRANEINFTILAALPAFFISLILAMLVRAWFKRDTRAEGRGRVARIQRRLLLVEIERAIMQFQSCKDQGLVRARLTI
ncbi:dgd1 suppressor 1 [Perilla frutescens var. frutescens]|nr:dgd1 suppressor 1 [Perilla frutescens var. frutescens]